MRGVVLRESEILREGLKGNIDKKPMTTLRVLAKHYLGQGLSKEETELKLEIYMQDNYEGYKPSKWKSLLNSLVKSINSFGMVDINAISITHNEWNSIKVLNDKQLEKLAFILLVYCKLNKVKHPDSENRVYNNLTDIFTESGIRMVDENKLLLNKLVNYNYISQGKSCNSTSLNIGYCEDNGEVKFIIDNFTNVISYYNEYSTGKKYFACKDCNKRLVQNSNSMKYCKKCANTANKKMTANNRKV